MKKIRSVLIVIATLSAFSFNGMHAALACKKKSSPLRIVEMISDTATGMSEDIVLPHRASQDSPIHQAVKIGDTDEFTTLLATIQSDPHFIAACELLNAVAHNNYDYVTELLEREAGRVNPNGFAFESEQTIGDAWAVWLYRSGNGHKTTMYKKNYLTQSMLLTAIINGQPNGALLEHGFFVPLCVAAFLGNTRMITLLLNHGASVNACCPSGKTPLMAAALGGNPEAVLALLKAKADIAQTDFYGNTALMYAAQGARETEGVYENKKAGANARAKEDATFRTNVFKELLAHGANPADTNFAGQTAMHMLVKIQPALLMYWIQLNPRNIMNYGLITPEIDEKLRKIFD